MKRTSADGHASNRYTEGNPSLGVAATVVGALELNNIQEEIVNVILDQGITLDGTIENQLLLALRSMIGTGGVQSQFSVLNNQASVVNLTGLLFDKTVTKSVEILFDLYRKTDTAASQRHETGKIFLTYDPVDALWRIAITSVFDDAGVTFSVSADGQLRYKSTDISGSNYVGTLRVSSITKLKQTI